MRATLPTLSAVALLALGAGPAVARPDESFGRREAVTHAANTRALGLRAEQRATAQAAAQGLRDEQRAAVAASRQSVPTPLVRVTRVADGGFEWADAGIGAGIAVALLLTAAGVATVRRQPTITS
jgi:hypothetical protein